MATPTLIIDSLKKRHWMLALTQPSAESLNVIFPHRGVLRSGVITRIISVDVCWQQQ